MRAPNVAATALARKMMGAHAYGAAMREALARGSGGVCPHSISSDIVLISTSIDVRRRHLDTDIEPLQYMYETAGEKCNMLRYALISSDMTESI